MAEAPADRTRPEGATDADHAVDALYALRAVTDMTNGTKTAGPSQGRSSSPGARSSYSPHRHSHPVYAAGDGDIARAAIGPQTPLEPNRQRGARHVRHR